MAVLIEKIVKEDFQMGYGTLSVSAPGGGSQTGTKVGIHTFMNDGFFNVMSFGAIGDGVADDTAAFTAALGALPSAGGTVWMPPNVFNVTSTLTVGNHKKLVGSGGGQINSVPPYRGVSTIVSSYNGTVIQAGSAGATSDHAMLEGFTVVGDTGQSSQDLIVAGPTGAFTLSYFSARDVQCWSAGRDTIKIQNMQNCELEFCRFDSATRYGCYITAASTNFVTVVKFDRCQFRVANRWGIFIDGLAGGTVQQVTFDNCTVQGNNASNPTPRTVTDAAITSGLTTLTSSTGAFTSADVGKHINVAGAGSGANHLITFIDSVTNSTTAVLGAAAGTTVSGATAVINGWGGILSGNQEVVLTGGSWFEANVGAANGGNDVFITSGRVVDFGTIYVGGRTAGTNPGNIVIGANTGNYAGFGVRPGCSPFLNIVGSNTYDPIIVGAYPTSANPMAIKRGSTTYTLSPGGGSCSFIPRAHSSERALAVGDFAVAAGWGSGAAVSAVSGTDQGFRFTVTAGTSPGANPSVTLTFKGGTWTDTPFATATMNVGSTGALAATYTGASATELAIGYVGTPVNGSTYVFDVNCNRN